jgi:hypothetical protein
MPLSPLVRELFAGPIDVVGDVHGEISALRALLGNLGYSPEGLHAEGRRLVFVGDLVDRGPDSPGVVRLVRRLVAAGRAQCVLGNHEFNIFLEHAKPDNFWFFGHEPRRLHPAHAADQVRADARDREEILAFVGTLPLALEREDVRVVHACWDDATIAAARAAAGVRELYRDYRGRIEEALRLLGIEERFAVKLAHQNRNPAKLLTSGPEEKAAEPFETMGMLRHERRVAWWPRYTGPLCLFGHYWRTFLPGEVDRDRLFVGLPKNALLAGGRAMCIDYSVGKRFHDRLFPPPGGVFHTQLAALRLPERILVFDDGERLPLVSPAP